MIEAENPVPSRIKPNAKLRKQKYGRYLLLAAVIMLVVKFLILEPYHPIQRYTTGAIALALIFSIVMVFDFKGILFDPEEELPNPDLPSIILKIRYRGILYNNIAILLFLITLAIIFMSFYFFFTNFNIQDNTNEENELANLVTTKIGASILLIFLVQLLFKIFKYLLRVAAFYNARADAIEFVLRNRLCEASAVKEPAINLDAMKIDLEKLMNVLTPSNYDISELERVSLFDGLTDFWKAKMGK